MYGQEQSMLACLALGTEQGGMHAEWMLGTET